MSCTTAHLRSRLLNIVSLSDMIEGSYRSWDLYATGQLVDGLQQKKRNPVFIKRKWNHVTFSRATILSFLPVCVLWVYMRVHVYVRECVAMCIRVHKCVCECDCVHGRVCKCVHTYVCLCVCSCVRACLCV